MMEKSKLTQSEKRMFDLIELASQIVLREDKKLLKELAKH